MKGILNRRTDEMDEMDEMKTSVSPREWDSALFDESWNRSGLPDRVFLMVKDARTVFVYWTVDQTRKKLAEQHFRRAWSDLPLYLQLYDVTDIQFDGNNAHSVKRISVGADADNWYIHDVFPRRNYIVDFGALTWNGNFFTLLRSNVAETPPEMNYRSGAGDVQFAPRYVSSQTATRCTNPEEWNEYSVRRNERVMDS